MSDITAEYEQKEICLGGGRGKEGVRGLVDTNEYNDQV